MRLCKRCNTDKEDDDFHKGQKWCKTCQSTYFHENKDKLQARRRQYREEHPEAKVKQWVQAKTRRIRSRERYLWTTAKYRAAKYGIEFTITKEDVVIPDRCPILGIRLTKGAMSKGDRNAPTLDRVDNTKGYTPENTRVISYRANSMKSDASLEELKKFSRGIKAYLKI